MRYSTNQFNIDFGNETLTRDRVITAGDFFAGGGGVTSALYKMPGVQVKWVLNHDKKAIKTNAFHHKDVKCYWANIFVQDEHELEPVDFVWASYECTQHSPGSGGRKKKLGSYMMGWELVRYLKFLQPMVVGIENVPEIKKWAPVDENGDPIKERQGEEFESWKAAIEEMGYEYKESIRVAADDGLPTIRKRYFAFFYRPGIEIEFPEHTHAKEPTEGKLKWNSCRPHIDTDSHGESIFGRQFNENLPKQHRKPYCKNSLRRMGGGAIKYGPELVNLAQYICQYYGGSDQSQSLDTPLNTVTTVDCHQLITIEKIQFIQDHCHVDNYQTPDDPLKTQLTWETKQLVSVETSFIAHMNNSNGKPEANVQSMDDPLKAITTKEKIQFITSFFNSSGKPHTQVRSLDDPLATVLTAMNKQQLVTILDKFDVKARFLTPEELSLCSTFERDYFTNPALKLSKKDAVKQIGNAVPPEWINVLVKPNVEGILKYKYAA